MKTIKIVALVILIIISVCVTIEATASESAISVQKSLMGASKNSGSAGVNIDVVVMIPDFPQVEALEFEDYADVPYELTGNSISVEAANVPTLYTALTEIPSSFKPITVAISPADSSLEASWTNKGDINVKGAGLRVQIFRKKKGEISKSTKPIIDFSLKDMDVSVEEADMKKGHFVFHFDAVFPKVDYELFDQYLSGKPVEGLITIDKD